MAACSSALRSSRTLPGHGRDRRYATVSSEQRRVRPEPAQEVVGQQRDVVRPVAQGRQVDLEDVQAEEQVVPELAGVHLLAAGP